MAQHITTPAAQNQKLSGFDTFKYSHSLYYSEGNRDVGIVPLNIQAFGLFCESNMIAYRRELAADQATTAKYFADGGMLTGVPPLPTFRPPGSSWYANYDALKIGTGFELHLKARLLGRDFVIHEIKREPACKDLAQQQRKRPIEVQELLRGQQYLFDGQEKENYHPGLSGKSVNFELLTSEPYRRALGLTNEQRDVIEYYRVLRNHIHLPGDRATFRTKLNLPPSLTPFLVSFMNTEIVEPTNSLISRHCLAFPRLEPLD